MASVFEHPWLSGLFADPEMATIWAADTQLRHMLAFEAAWSRSGHLAGLWNQDEGEAAAAAIERLKIDPAALAEGTGQDGVCVPALVAILKDKCGPHVHKGATSQDVIDTGLALSMVATLDLLEKRVGSLAAALGDLDRRFGDASLMGRTRMQAAVLITVRDRLQSWSMPLDAHLVRIAEVRPRVARVQIGGAAGDRAMLGGEGHVMVAELADRLGLQPTSKAWHAMRDGVVEFASLLSLISGTLGKMGQDVALMAQQGIDEIRIKGGGGSSAMPHKQNPVTAELLVTLARFNATQIGGMHQALVHEQERSGAAWSLEWMLLPQMAEATGRGLMAGLELVSSIEELGRK